MSSNKKWGLVLLSSMLLMSISCSQGTTTNTTTTITTTTTTTTPPTTSGNPSVQNGRDIFLYADSSSGDPLYPTGFGVMMYYTCASCHGPMGHGSQIFLRMQVFDVPDITWTELTGTHEDHQPYTIETVKKAITEGLDPAGNRLDYPMPSWVISDRDLNDLLAFLQTLD